jgi:outer membrane protein OmpA-like peptidoglycan-associated protein
LSAKQSVIDIDPAAACRLEPLNLRETEDFIRHVAAAAGTRATDFGPAAVKRIWRLSRGVPAQIDKICMRALRFGCVRQPPDEYSEPLGRSVEASLSRPLGDEAAACAESVAKPRKTARLSFLTLVLGLAAAAAAGLVSFEDRLPSSAALFDSEFYRRMVGGVNVSRPLDADPASSHPPQAPRRPMLPDLQPERNSVAQPVAGRSFVIHFTDEAGAISQETLLELNRITAMISDFSNTEILIAAMIDASGNYWQNRKLSNLRANTVKSFFIGKGVLPSNIEIVLSEMEEAALVEPAVRAEMTAGRVKITFRANSIS